MNGIERKCLLYKTKVEYGDYTINHVLGCSHGCKFPCYAYLLAKRFGKVKKYSEWIKPRIVINALELLDKEIPKYKSNIKSVQLSFTTDPFMYKHKDISELSISIINKLNQANIKCICLTKGIIPREALMTKKYNEYGITLVSIDENFRRKYEPNTAKYLDRINSLKMMHNKGFKTWVSIEPYPTPNIVDQDLNDILDKISFVDYIVFGKWNYNKLISNYKEKKEFYNSCVKQVRLFCKENNIKLHIKRGTIIK